MTAAGTLVNGTQGRAAQREVFPGAGCRECGCRPAVRPSQISRAALTAAVAYQRHLLAFAAETAPDDLAVGLVVEVIAARDAVHVHTARLAALADLDPPTVHHSDPLPAPPVASDHGWGAVAGLVAVIEELAETITGFPPDRWTCHAVHDGRHLTALDLANHAAHHAVHHLTAHPASPSHVTGPTRHRPVTVMNGPTPDRPAPVPGGSRPPGSRR